MLKGDREASLARRLPTKNKKKTTGWRWMEEKNKAVNHQQNKARTQSADSNTLDYTGIQILAEARRLTSI